VKEKVFIAGPYTKGDVALNVRKAARAADRVWAAGFTPFLPHLTHLWHLISPHPYLDWLALDLEWLAVCDHLVRLPGESGGADGEVARALELRIPVYEGLEEFLGCHAPDRGGEFLPPVPPPPDPAVLAIPVRNLRWPARARRAFNRLGVTSLGGVSRLSAQDLRAQRGVGPGTVQEVRDRLALHGLALAGEAPPGSVAPWGEPGTQAAPLEPAPAPVAQSGT
jgi:hypothetical protein